MGVKSLSQFIDENPYLTNNYELHDTQVIIDASTLVSNLYIRSKAPDIFGGDYSKYAATIKEYFSSYAECNVKPIVIFDGGLDESDYILDQLQNRQKYMFQEIKQIEEKGENQNFFIPVNNTYEVFKNILSEIGVKFVQCDYEGNNQIAALANEYKCPVISEDSDFYIFRLTQGFIRSTHIDTHVKTKNINDIEMKYLECRIYYASTLLEYFNLDKNVLPLVATIAGNNFIPFKVTKNLLYKIRPYPKKFPGLFYWLQNNTLDEAIMYITARETIVNKESIKYSLENYQIRPTNLRSICEVEVLSMNDEVGQKTKMVARCGAKLPLQFVIAFHKGLLPSFLLEVITLHRRFLSPQVEEFSNSSVYECSRYVRQVIYGILLQHDSETSENHDKMCIRKIDEYDRIDDNLQRVEVNFVTKLKNGKDVPRLTAIYDMDKDCLRDFIAKVMGVELSYLSDIQSNLQLLFGCLEYWLLNCSPKPTKQFLVSFMLCLIYHQLLEKNITESISLNKDKMQNDHLKNVPNLVENISSSAAEIVLKNFNKYSIKPNLSSPTNFLNRHIVHSYIQLQSCILDFGTLNSLLCLPFEPLKLYKTVDGTMLYNLTKCLLSCQNAADFVKNILSNNSAIFGLLNNFMGKVLENIPDDYFMSNV